MRKVDVGRDLVRSQGWWRAALPSPRGVFLGAGKTFHTGPTAAFRYIAPPASGATGAISSGLSDYLGGGSF